PCTPTTHPLKTLQYISKYKWIVLGQLPHFYVVELLPDTDPCGQQKFVFLFAPQDEQILLLLHANLFDADIFLSGEVESLLLFQLGYEFRYERENHLILQEFCSHHIFSWVALGF